MLLQARSRAQTRRKRWAIAIALVAIGAVWLGKDSAAQWYQRRRVAKALAQARAFSARRDFDNALLSLRVASEAGGANLENLRLTADILDLDQRPDALSVRETILRLVPDSAVDRLAYVQTALRVGDIRAADAAFQLLSAAEMQTPEAQHLLAALRVAQHRPTEAEAVLAGQAKNPVTAARTTLELTLLRLHHVDRSIHEDSRQVLLATLTTAPSEVKIAILRELLADAMARGESGHARLAAEQLTHLPDASFEDWLRRLDVERRWPGLSSQELLAEIRARAASRPADAAQLEYWLISANRPDTALIWLESLPPAVARAPEVRATVACALATTQRWDKLAGVLRGGAWGQVQGDTIELAFETKRLADQHDVASATEQWSRALTTARDRQADLVVLVRLASLWHLTSAQRSALLHLVEQFPDERWALQRLLDLAYRAGDTAELREAWRAWLGHHPDDRGARGDLLTVTFLLESHRPAPALLEEARRLHDTEPRNPYFTTTLALGRWRDGATHAAVELLEQLPEAERCQGARAVYYCAMLADLGETTKAARYLPTSNASLLPEERSMLVATAMRVARREPASP